MRKRFMLSFLVVSTLLSSCSAVSSDAESAAKLNKKSLEHTREKNLQKADEAYQEMKAIFDKYKDTEEFDKFKAAYSKAMYGEQEEI